MKTLTTAFLLAFILPVSLFAQPTIRTNEFYNIGDDIQMVNCDASSISAGAPGAGLTWNFASLSSSGGLSSTTVATNTSSAFITANLAVTLPNGFIEYVQENSSDSYIDGMFDPATNVTTNYNRYDESKRPFTYNTTYVDTYRVIITTPATIGSGYLTETGDAYGTLILPTGTFDNVLRIKKVQIETDSMSGSVSALTYTTSYLWFDTLHNAPLFRMDSISNLAGTSNTATYLAIALSVKDISSAQSNFYGSLNNNTLQLFGSFEYGMGYDVLVYNMIGTKVFNESFTAYSTSQNFDIGRQIVPGIYMVSLTQKNDPASRNIIKVVKQ